MTETNETQAAEATAKATRAEASNFLPIVRGRLPLLFVHAVRFDSVLNAMGNKDLASKLATSVGKVFDIKKGRNFAYVGSDYKPTQADVDAAEAWLAQVGADNAKGLKANGDTTLMRQVIDQYKDAGLASAEQEAALNAARTANRKPVAPRAPKAAGSEGQSVSAAQTGSAESLLS